MAAICRIRWVKKGRSLVSQDKRLAITPSGRRGFDVVDLDTYNEASAQTLAAAKRKACRLIKGR